MRKSLADRLWSRMVKSENGCWMWTGVLRDPKGYGAIVSNGRRLRAHRVAWQLTHGPIPEGMCACHHCDTPACINPDHLFLGTNGDNNRDRNAKGRTYMPRSEQIPNAKLTDVLVAEIKARLRNGEPHSRLAPDYGVSRQTISAIACGRRWAHVVAKKDGAKWTT